MQVKPVCTKYYEILGVSWNSTTEEIQKAYKKKVLLVHPDKRPNEKEKAEKEFIELQKAFETLRSKKSRTDYDKYGEEDQEDEYEDDSSDCGVEVVDDETAEWIVPDEILKKHSTVISDIEWEESLDKSKEWTKEIFMKEFKKISDKQYPRLKFVKKGIKNLPEKIFQALELKGNFLTKVDFSNNKFTKIPDSICDCKNLELLFFDMNLLTCLPSRLGELKKLTQMSVEHNKITNLPGVFKFPPNIVKINLYANCLKDLPPSLSSLQKLRFLDIEMNQIEKIPFGLLKKGVDVTYDENVKFVKKTKANSYNDSHRKTRAKRE